MTPDTFISAMKLHGAVIAPPATQSDISATNAMLQAMRASILPKFIIDLYTHTGGISLGSGYIFGPKSIAQGTKYPVPSITDINQDTSRLSQLYGKTIFGRNDLFWFVFDAYGKCIMLDNLTLRPLKQYDDPYRAMTDCLVAGKF